MNRLRESFMRFMSGRYGTDNLNRFLFWVYIAAFAANLFINSSILFILVWIVVIVYIFRTLSRNIYKRQKENVKYLQIINQMTRLFNFQKKKLRDIKTHVYRKCPNCRASLRLPRKRGCHTVSCPRCRKDFEVKV